MKHVRYVSAAQMPVKAQEVTCGWLFKTSNTKCVDTNDPLAPFLKRVPIP